MTRTLRRRQLLVGMATLVAAAALAPMAFPWDQTDAQNKYNAAATAKDNCNTASYNASMWYHVCEGQVAWLIMKCNNWDGDYQVKADFLGSLYSAQMNIEYAGNHDYDMYRDQKQEQIELLAVIPGMITAMNYNGAYDSGVLRLENFELLTSAFIANENYLTLQKSYYDAVGAAMVTAGVIPNYP